MELKNKKYQSIKNKNIFHDTLELLETDSGANADYQRGVVVAVVGMLMASGFSLDAAIVAVVQGLKNKHRQNVRFNLEVVPETWREKFTLAWETVKRD